MKNHMELKNRVVIVNEKNMEALTSLYGECSIDELERIVNDIIDNAVMEIMEDEGRECVKRLHKVTQSSVEKMNCNSFGFSRTYDYGRRIVYRDHEDRKDDIGKVSVDDLSDGSPEWCPLRCNR